MGALRTLAILLGVVALAAAVAALANPSALADAGVGETVQETPIDTVVKLGLALVFGVLGLFTGVSRATTGVRSLPTPEVVGSERTVAGADLDRQLQLIADDDDDLGRQARGRVRREVRSVAVDTLVDLESVSEETAHQWLETGQWTADPRASVFLGGDDVERPPLKLRLHDWLSADPTFTRRARATVNELTARRDEL